MEIPQPVKELYRHWQRQIDTAAALHSDRPALSLDKEVLKDIHAFIGERQRIFEKKSAGKPRPYTEDPILNQYKFCNIYRELDRQTIQIHRLLNPMRDNFQTWLLNLMYMRFVANPETVIATGFLRIDDEKHNERIFACLKELPRPIYGSAYIFPISVLRKSDTQTRELFFTRHLPRVAEKVAEVVLAMVDESVCDALEAILPKLGFPFKFHMTEVLIDVAYQFPERINLFKKFPIGPGSMPTMKRLNPKADPSDVCLALVSHQPSAEEFLFLKFNGRPIPLSAENWEGIGCEFRKYTNLNAGGGRKRRYAPAHSI